MYERTVKENKELQKQIAKKDKTIWELSCVLSEIVTIQRDTQTDVDKELKVAEKLLRSAAVKNVRPPK